MLHTSPNLNTIHYRFTPCYLDDINQEVLDLVGNEHFDVLGIAWGTFVIAYLLEFHCSKQIDKIILCDPACFLGGQHKLYSYHYHNTYFDSFAVQAFYRTLIPYNCHVGDLCQETQEKIHVFIAEKDELLLVSSIVHTIRKFYPRMHLNVTPGKHGQGFGSNRKLIKKMLD